MGPALVTLENLIFDGNKTERTTTGILCQVCVDTGKNPFIGSRPKLSGVNLSMDRSDRFQVLNIESNNALCGSALVLSGPHYEVANSAFQNNGVTSVGSLCQPLPPGTFLTPWSDGITAGFCDGGYIHDNLLLDNTDVALPVGGCGTEDTTKTPPDCIRTGLKFSDCLIERNTIRQINSHAFAGLAVANFNSEGMGCHYNSVYQSNTILSNVKNGVNQLDFGLFIGMHPWEPTDPTRQGVIRNNRVGDAGNGIPGAIVNLAVDGYENGTVTGNVLENAQGTFSAISLISPMSCTDPLQSDYTLGHVKQSCVPVGFDTVAFDGSKCVQVNCVVNGQGCASGGVLADCN